MKRLFLLDGMALVYRAHFAFIQAPIRTSKGVNTSALYGFTNTLLSILEKESPTHIGVAFDTSEPTARHIKYPAYKAQRDEMPEELAAAIPHVKSLCRALHIPVLELGGYEADDIIGTLVKRAELEGFESYMVTPDKDFAQLLSPKTYMWRPGRKGNDHEIIGLNQLMEIWGVESPLQIIDLLGLMGDASDNIPGVPGIGPKTAQKLIAQFGSMEKLLAQTSKLKGKQKESIEAYADQALLSKDLATIWVDVPIDYAWQDLMIDGRDDDALKSLLAEFELRTLTRRIFGEASNQVEKNKKEANEVPTLFQSFKTISDVDHRYQIADSPELKEQLFSELKKQKRFCFDIETTSLDRFETNLLGIAFSWQAHEGWYLPWSDDLKPRVQEVLSLESEKIGHHLKFDLSVLMNHGIEVKGPFFDTMLVDSLVAPERRHTMDYLSEIHLGYRPVKLLDLVQASALKGGEEDGAGDLFQLAAKKSSEKAIDMKSIPLEKLAEYAAEDADVTFQLAEILRPLLKAKGQDRVWIEIEGPLLPVLVRMEMNGITLDVNALGEIGGELDLHLDQLVKSIYQQAGKTFNIGSPKQLGEVLFNDLNLADKAKKTKTGQYKTDEQTLQTLEGKHPIIADILSWRESSKLKSTYLDALPQHCVKQTGRIHTHFHQLVAATGRLASSDPNLQNIPVRSEAGKKVRKAFICSRAETAGGGYELLSCDYSQIELRVMAAIANDTAMIEAFQNHEDIHRATAAKVFGVASDQVTGEMRRTAKMVNFGIIYGISAFGLSQRLGIPRAEAAEVIEAYFREYPAIRLFMENTVRQARDQGYVETLGGRRRSFPDLDSANQNLRSNAERSAINTPIQGTAADMIKLAMVQIDQVIREGRFQSRMLLQVHDELVFDLAEHEKEILVPKILGCMKHALELPNGVPIEVEYGIGPNWLVAH